MHPSLNESDLQYIAETIEQLRGLSMDVGVIGVGAMGRNHVRVYSELKGVDTVYVYDPVPENAERMKEFATICKTQEELLGKGGGSQHLCAHQVPLRDGQESHQAPA